MIQLMRRIRGIKLGRKTVRVFKWVIRRTRKPTKYQRLQFHRPINKNNNNDNKAVSKLYKWSRSIRRGAKKLCFFKSSPGYIRVGQQPDETKRVSVPKGHLAIYVGEKEDEMQRVLVPVLYLNHPLFGRLLKEAEEIFGFDHPGQITLPCPISEFETVQTKIAAGAKCKTWHHRRLQSVKCLQL
ncbi:hypothetical protein Ancab_032499 [Ancistrocladus abbreviatus]